VTEWIDISQPFTVDMHPVGRSAKMAMRLETLQELDEDHGHASLQLITVFGHQGTHIDTPAHVMGNSPTIDKYPVSRFTGSGVVWGIPKERQQTITVEDLEAARPTVEPGDFVVVRTGMERYIPTDEYYENAYFEEDAAKWLVGRGIRLIGHDMISVDPPVARRGPDFRYTVHKTFLANDVLIAGQLCNLESLVGKRAEFFFFPLNIIGADGSPTRAVARVTS
jgi:kynurenine formamidase